MSGAHDLLVVGAGPAGMAAAALAAQKGAEVLLVDEQPAPGGQIWRAVESPGPADPSILGPDYTRGAALARDFRRSGAAYLPGAAVWQVNPDGRVGLSADGEARFITGKRVILATGAMEHPFPIPGWTLPGVMTAGAGQILLKSAGVVPREGVVLAGLGPLLYLLAWQYLRAGVRVSAILETTPRDALRRAAPLLPAAMMGGGLIGKGLSLMRAIRRAGIRHVKGVTALSALGTDRVEAVEFAQGERTERIATPLLLLHQGVVPNVNLPMSVPLAHRWDEAQLSWRPEVDEWGRSSAEAVLVAGDGAGIGGVETAEAAGAIAAAEALRALGRIGEAERDALAGPHRARRQRLLKARPFLDALYRPPRAFRVPADDATLVCRCEEVTAGMVRERVAQGAGDLNQVKAHARCGMGPCQGRLCGLTVAEIVAEATGRTPGEVPFYRIRPPVKPIGLSEILAFDDGTVPPEAATPRERRPAKAAGS